MTRDLSRHKKKAVLGSLQKLNTELMNHNLSKKLKKGRGGLTDLWIKIMRRRPIRLLAFLLKCCLCRFKCSFFTTAIHSEHNFRDLFLQHPMPNSQWLPAEVWKPMSTSCVKSCTNWKIWLNVSLLMVLGLVWNSIQRNAADLSRV